MILDEAISLIRSTMEQMNAYYGGTVFNEWVVLSSLETPAHILRYEGPRQADFPKNLGADLDTLRKDLESQKLSPGDFEFARHAGGTRFDAFLVLGPRCYLICNNTSSSMDAITKDTRWLGAQVPFVEMSDKLRVNPVVVSALS